MSFVADYIYVLAVIMAESIVADWLADYEALEPAELRTFAAQHEHNHEIAHALFTIIGERVKYPDVSEISLKWFILLFLTTFYFSAPSFYLPAAMLVLSINWRRTT